MKNLMSFARAITLSGLMATPVLPAAVHVPPGGEAAGPGSSPPGGEPAYIIHQPLTPAQLEALNQDIAALTAALAQLTANHHLPDMPEQ